MSNNPNYKEIIQAYGFDDVAVAPGDITINPELISIATRIGGMDLEIPVLASAMDSVVSPEFAGAMTKAGGLAILNLDGIHVRYSDPTPVYEEIARTSLEKAEEVLQRVYAEPAKENLVGESIGKMKAAGARAAVSVIPASAKRMAGLAEEAGAELLVVQSTVTTARHLSPSGTGLRFDEMKKQLKVPVVVGNSVSYDVTLELMRQGVDGVLVGVGPGAACTSREVLGIGVPQVTATVDCAAARDAYQQETGRYVPIVTDGGIRTGGDVVKSFVCGADAVMLGSPFAKTEEAPCSGFHWGMAAPHSSLPRGTRLDVGTAYSLRKLLFGPSDKTNGTENLMDALRTAMGMIGAKTIVEMRKAQILYAPAIKSEGKIYQLSGLAA